MKMPMKLSRRTKPYQCGEPVNNDVKTSLRNRSSKLTSEQISSLKKMGIRMNSKNTEKEAASVAKRVCDFYYSKDNHPRQSPKPKRISKRQHSANVLEYDAALGSHKADKRLSSGKY